MIKCDPEEIRLFRTGESRDRQFQLIKFEVMQ